MSQYEVQIARFQRATKELTDRQQAFPDANVNLEFRRWLDGNDTPLNWHHNRDVTPDEYFFITTLYRNMPLGVKNCALSAMTRR